MRLLNEKLVKTTIQANWQAASAAVQFGYAALCAGSATNPPSSFLRIPGGNRAIALTACLHGSISGVKWIAGYPGNVQKNIPRANAVIVLNDIETGIPIALMDGSYISAYRTISLAMDFLDLTQPSGPQVGLIGAGNISREFVQQAAMRGYDFEYFVYDVAPNRASDFHGATPADATWILENCSVVLFATSAGSAWVNPRSRANQVLLHLSLRDLEPEYLEQAINVVDDKAAATSEGTALSFTSAKTIDDVRTLHDLGRAPITSLAKPIVYSPFGLGVLDIALAKHVLDSNVDAPRVSLV